MLSKSETTILGLTFPDFDPATKREVWLLRIWFGIAPVNKLVSLLVGAEKLLEIYITLHGDWCSENEMRIET